MQTGHEWTASDGLFRYLVVCVVPLIACACAPSATSTQARPTAAPTTAPVRMTALLVRHVNGSAITRPVKAGTKVRVEARVSFTTPNGFDPHAYVTVRQGSSTIAMTPLGTMSNSLNVSAGTADFQGTVPIFPAQSGHVTLTVGANAGPESAAESTTIPAQASSKAPRHFSLRVAISPAVMMHNTVSRLVVHALPGAVCRARVPQATGYWLDMVGARGRLDWEWKATTVGNGTVTVRCSYMGRSETARASFTVV